MSGTVEDWRGAYVREVQLLQDRVLKLQDELADALGRCEQIERLRQAEAGARPTGVVSVWIGGRSVQIPTGTPANPMTPGAAGRVCRIIEAAIAAHTVGDSDGAG